VKSQQEEKHLLTKQSLKFLLLRVKLHLLLEKKYLKKYLLN
jgi:hypothetical protein